MPLRYVKIGFVLCLGLWALFTTIGSLLTLANTYRNVARVSSGSGLPPIVKPLYSTTSPLLNWLGVALILVGKVAATVCLFIGLWCLWQARLASAEVFNAAKTWALVGGWINVLWLFAGFGLFGEIVFYMFASERGAAEANSAYRYAGYFAFALLFLGQPD